MRHLLSSDTALVRRARYGDRRAARRLAARHLDRIALLCAVVGTEAGGTGETAQRAFALALKQRAPFDDALVIAFALLTASRPDAKELQSRLLTLLVDVELRPADAAASLLGVSGAQTMALRPEVQASAVNPGRSCRGWGLASRRTGLTVAERRAGEAHLRLCRRCRDRLVTLDRARAQLLGGSAGAAGGVIAAAELIPLAGGQGLGVGVGGLLTAKAGAAVVGALGAAVLVTGGTAAVTTRPADAPAVPRSAPSEPAGRASPAGPRPVVPARSSTTAPSPSSTLLPGLPTVQRLDESPAAPLPTELPVPELPLPVLPLPLPTELPHVLPLPTAVATLLDLP